MTDRGSNHVKGCAMKVRDMEVILKVRIDAVHENEADAKKVEELIKKYGMGVCQDPTVLFTKIIETKGK